MPPLDIMAGIPPRESVRWEAFAELLAQKIARAVGGSSTYCGPQQNPYTDVPCMDPQGRHGQARVTVGTTQTLITDSAPGNVRKGGFIVNLSSDTVVWLGFLPGLNSIGDGIAPLVAQGSSFLFAQPCWIYQGAVWGIVETGTADVGVLMET